VRRWFLLAKFLYIQGQALLPCTISLNPGNNQYVLARCVTFSHLRWGDASGGIRAVGWP
jgi:hypothetical protein